MSGYVFHVHYILTHIHLSSSTWKANPTSQAYEPHQPKRGCAPRCVTRKPPHDTLRHLKFMTEKREIHEKITSRQLLTGKVASEALNSHTHSPKLPMWEAQLPHQSLKFSHVSLLICVGAIGF